MDDPRIAMLLGGAQFNPEQQAAEEARQRAAFLMRRGVQPEGGRQEGAATDIFNALRASLVRGAMAGPNAMARVASGELDPNSPEGIAEARNIAMSTMGSGMAFAKPGAAGIFGGRLAQTADHAALAKAEKMVAEGHPPENIWNETGWFKGADDKWRFEIPDQGEMRLKAPLPDRGSEAWLDKTVDAPLSAAAYPSLFGGTEIARGDLGRGMWQHGNVTDQGVIIPHRLSVGPKADRGTLLHEFQHGIQRAEDFATGSNALALRPGTPAWDIYQERLKAMRTPLSHEEFSQRANYEGMAPQKDYQDYLKTTRNIPPMADRSAQEYAVQEAYRRHAGEVEARNVQSRMNMTPEQRRAAPPWTTEDVPREQQIVRQLMGGPQMSTGRVPAIEAPPPEPGMVRLFHGGHDYAGGPRWVTTNRKYAQTGYTTPGATVPLKNGRYLQYVDVPKDSPFAQMPEGHSTNSFHATEELAKQLRPFYSKNEP